MQKSGPKPIIFSNTAKLIDSLENFEQRKAAALSGNISLHNAQYFLSHQEYYIHLNFYEYLNIIRHHPDLVRTVFQHPKLPDLLGHTSLVVLCMNHPELEQEAIRLFKIDPDYIGTVKYELKKNEPSEKKKSFVSQDAPTAGQILVDFGRQSTLNAKQLLAMKDLSRHLSLEDLVQLAEEKESVAERILNDKTMTKPMYGLLLVRLSYNHPKIIQQVVERKDLWKKLSLDQKVFLGSLNEYVAHKILDHRKYYKHLTEGQLYEIAQSALSVSDRVLKTPMFAAGILPQFQEKLMDHQRFCIQLAKILKGPSKVHKPSAM